MENLSLRQRAKKRGNPIVEDRVVYWHQRTNYYSLAASSSFL